MKFFLEFTIVDQISNFSLESSLHDWYEAFFQYVEECSYEFEWGLSLGLLFDWIDCFLLKVDFCVRFCTIVTLHSFALLRYSFHLALCKWLGCMGDLKDEKLPFFFWRWFFNGDKNIIKWFFVWERFMVISLEKIFAQNNLIMGWHEWRIVKWKSLEE